MDAESQDPVLPDPLLDVLVDYVRGGTDGRSIEELEGFSRNHNLNLEVDLRLVRKLAARSPELISRGSRGLAWTDGSESATRSSRPVNEISALVEQWIEAKQEPDRTATGEKIQLAVEDLSPSDRSLPEALGVVPTKSPGSPFDRLAIDSKWSPKVVTALIEQTTLAQRGWLLKVVSEFPQSQTKSAVKKLEKLSDADRSEMVCQAVAGLSEQPEQTGVAPAVQRMSKLMPQPPSRAAVESLLRAVATLSRRSDTSEWDASVGSIMATAATADLATLAEASSIAFEQEDARSVAISLARRTAKDQDARVAALSAIGASGHIDALATFEAWRGLSLDSIGRVVEHLGSVAVSTRPIDSTLRSACQSEVKAIGQTLDAVARRPALEPFIPIDLLVRLSRREHADSRLVRAVVERNLEEAEQESSTARAEAEAGWQVKIDQAEARAAQAEASAQEAQERSEQSTSRLRRFQQSANEAHEAQLRQARIDALRRLVELIEAVRSASAVDSRSAVMATIVSDAESAAESMDATKVGSAGEACVVAPEHFGLPAGPPTALEVLEPAWVIKDGNVEVPLRYGRARSEAEAEQ